MRKTFVIAALGVLTLGEPAAAQRAGDTFVGIIGGATLADFGGTNTGSKWGGTAGVFGAFRASRNAVSMLEVLWTQKGDEFTKLDYIEVVLTGGAVVPTQGGGRFRLYAGIDAAFKISCSTTSLASDCTQAKTPIWSIPLGFMVGRTSNNGVFTGLDVRYDLALTDTFRNRFVWNRTWYFRVMLGKGRGRAGRR